MINLQRLKAQNIIINDCTYTIATRGVEYFEKNKKTFAIKFTKKNKSQKTFGLYSIRIFKQWGRSSCHAYLSSRLIYNFLDKDSNMQRQFNSTCPYKRYAVSKLFYNNRANIIKLLV